MMSLVLSKTNESLLFGLAIPLNDTSIFRTGINMLRCDLEGGNTFRMTPILNGIVELVPPGFSG